MKAIRLITLVALILLVSIYSWTQLHATFTVELLGRDFAAYWASGRLLLLGEDPYSAENVLSIQQSLGWKASKPIIMYNPPWVLTFLLPFCMVDFVTGKILWMLCMLALILLSADRLWLLYGGSREKRVWAMLVVMTFSPVYFSCLLGQIVPLMLLGLVGFHQGIENRRWWLASAFLVLLAVKPHTLYLFWFALLFWAVKYRLWQILMGTSVALLCATLIPLFYNPNIASLYFSNIVTKSYATHWATPTVGYFLRLYSGFQSDWLQYVPTWPDSHGSCSIGPRTGVGGSGRPGYPF